MDKVDFTKEQKKVLKGVDEILKKIDSSLPVDAPVSLVASLFNLYIEIYKK